ncbi:MAG: MarR family transcriptional regulator [Candidatus Thorarchaeota archaeon]
MSMSESREVEDLKREIMELRRTVQTLRETVNKLTQRLEGSQTHPVKTESGIYSISANLDSCLQDASWGRLLNLLQKADSGLTAAELAKRWGKSRSRTSEVLNKLVEEGHLVKYRDGREIRFRALSDQEEE